MASGSSSSSSSASSMFFGTIAADPHIDLMMNSQQHSNFGLPTSLTPAQLHHLVGPVEQTMIHGPSYPEAEIVVAVSPNTLLADGNRYICDICYKGFPRQQNLQLHGRVHNLPFKLKTRGRRGVVQRKVYICPEPTCAHHNRSHALGDFGGLKKHYLRKHSNQKKHECNSCPKKYAVETDLKAHLKICGKKKYNCSCGAPFSRRSHFTFHQAFCDEEEQKDAAKHPPTSDSSDGSTSNNNNSILIGSTRVHLPTFDNNNHNSPSGPQISSIQTPFNSCPSQLSQFGTDHEITDPSLGLQNTRAFSSPSLTQENQLQGNYFDLGFYTNLLMMNNHPYHNFDLNNVTFMGEGGIYGSEEAGSISNSLSGGGIMLDHSSSLHSASAVHNATLRQQLSNPQLVLNEDLLQFASGNNSSNYNMVQGGLSSSSSGIGGFMMPQEHSLIGSTHFGIADDIGYNTNQNEVQNPVSGNAVGFNQDDVDVSTYMKGGYYGFGDGSHHGY